MTFQLPDDGTPFARNVRRRAQEEYIMWLVTVDKRGAPQPTPIWFWWDEATSSFLVYNMARAKRLEVLAQHSQVAMHFNGDATGSGIIVFSGHAQLSPDEPPADQHPLYLAKYHHWMTSMFGTPEKFAAEYSVALRIYPKKVRGSSL